MSYRDRFIIALLVLFILYHMLPEGHSLEVVAQNEGTCQRCGAQTIVTIRETRD